VTGVQTCALPIWENESLDEVQVELNSFYQKQSSTTSTQNDK
jgi:hypothetical protein